MNFTNAESPGEDAKIVVSIPSEDDDDEDPQIFKTNAKTIQAYSDEEDGEIKIGKILNYFQLLEEEINKDVSLKIFIYRSTKG